MLTSGQKKEGSVVEECMSPCPGNNKREEKEIPTKISNVIESVVCDI